MRKLLIGLTSAIIALMCVACGEEPVTSEPPTVVEEIKEEQQEEQKSIAEKIEKPLSEELKDIIEKPLSQELKDIVEEIEKPPSQEPTQEEQIINTPNIVAADKAFKSFKSLYKDEYKRRDLSLNFDKVCSNGPNEYGMMMDSYKITDKVNCCIFYKENNFRYPESILIYGRQIETDDELHDVSSLGAAFVYGIAEQDFETYLCNVVNCMSNQSSCVLNTSSLYIEIDCTEFQFPVILIGNIIR